MHLSSTELHTVNSQGLLHSLLDDGGDLVDQLDQSRGVDHQWKSREETVVFSNQLASMSNPKFPKSELVVFWDVDGSPTDEDGKFYVNITSALGRSVRRCKVFIIAYFDKKVARLSDSMWHCVTQIRDVAAVEGNRYPKVNMMALDILFWAMNNDYAPRNLVLISKSLKDSGKFDSVIEALRAKGLNLILAQPDEFPGPDLHTNGSTSFESLCQSLSTESKLQGEVASSIWRKLDILGVFWDVEDIPPIYPFFIHMCIRSTLESKGYDGHASITAYIDAKASDQDLLNDYKKSGMTVRHAPKGDKDARVAKMSLDMLIWAAENHEPANLIVISKAFKNHAMFDKVVRVLEARGSKVHLAQLDNMVTFRSAAWSAKLLAHSSAASAKLHVLGSSK